MTGLLTLTIATPSARIIDRSEVQALLGDDLEALHAQVLAMRSERIESDRERKVDQTRLHARAVRAMMQLMRGTAPDFAAAPKGSDDGIPAK